MDRFVTHAKSLDVQGIVVQSIFNGIFFSVMFSWQQSLSQTIDVVFSAPQTLLAMYAQTFILTFVSIVCVAILSVCTNTGVT